MKYSLSFLILIIFFSCKDKNEQTLLKDDVQPLLSVVKEYPSVKQISPIFRKDVENWEELNAIADFLDRFKKGSANEVLSNALELKGLIKSLKDSVKPNLFDDAAFKTRINILNNETLRLADMTSISAITAEEVHLQTEKIINAFSAINAKINTVLSKKRFEDEIGVSISFIGLDSTKMDSVTRKSLNSKVKLGPMLDEKTKPKKLKPQLDLKTKQ
ncbi:MAG: hypothetical protein P8P88_06930 [Polaribacter sp.]|nr:hypothetical protein [Polaribacter sp.]